MSLIIFEIDIFDPTIISAFFACFDSQTRVRFEQIKTNSKFHEKHSGFVDSGLGCMIGRTS